MDTCPIRSFPKIWQLGSTEGVNVFRGPVEVTEKMDGSQFAFGKVNGELVMRSKGTRIYPGSEQKLFKLAVATVLGMENRLDGGLPNGVIYYAEAITSPRHNTLEYERIPQGGLVLFGKYTEDEMHGVHMGGHFESKHSVLKSTAEYLGIDVVPLLFSGEIAERSQLDVMLLEQSYLGRETIEGVVIKNYHELAVSAHSSECFVKLVRPAFKERNSGEHVKEKNSLDEFLNQFKTDARWTKSIQRLRDDGKLTGTNKDIGPLIQDINTDLLLEEESTIKEALFNLFRRDIMSRTTKGFPEFYKNLILDTATAALKAE